MLASPATYGNFVERFIPLRCLSGFCCALFFLAPLTFASSNANGDPEGAALARSEAPTSTIVIGFVGGFVRHDSARHGPVKFAQRMQETLSKGAYVRVFENRRRKKAYEEILRLLDTDHDGSVSAEEKSHARIVLFGHSWGAAAAVLLAHDLERQHIPVLLTVQVDSVPKFWQDDSMIPPNVSEAVNFYQPHGLIHGRAQIAASDPSRTHIVGNYEMDYRKSPVQCGGRSWFDHLTPSHAQSECDPQLWSRIEEMVEKRIEPDALSGPSATP